MKNIVQLFFLLLVISCSTTSNLNKTEAAKEQFQEVKELVQSGEFQFQANRAFPLGNDATRLMANIPGSQNMFQGNSVDLSSNVNFLKIDGKYANVRLPYFGRILVAKSYGGNGAALDFDSEIEDYEVTIDEANRKILIEFRADDKNDNCQFQLSISSSKNTTLSVNSRTLQSIRYQGELFALEKQEENKDLSNKVFLTIWFRKAFLE